MSAKYRFRVTNSGLILERDLLKTGSIYSKYGKKFSKFQELTDIRIVRAYIPMHVEYSQSEGWQAVAYCAITRGLYLMVVSA